MSGERGDKPRDGAFAGYSGVIQSFLGAITPSDVTVYDPPLMAIQVGAAGAGTLVLIYSSDSETVAANRDTVTVTNSQLLTGRAIRQVRAASTATGLLGYQ